MDNHSDQPKFTFRYPVFICIEKEGVKGANLPWGQKAILAFTDPDLASRFLGELDALATTVVIPAERDQFALLLRTMQPAGFTHVVFDDEGKARHAPRTVTIPEVLHTIDEQQKAEKGFIMNTPLQPDPLPLFLPASGYWLDQLMVADDMWRILAKNGCLSIADVEAELRRLSQLVAHVVPASLRGLERDVAVLSRDRNRVSLGLWASSTMPETIRDAVLDELRRRYKDEVGIQ